MFSDYQTHLCLTPIAALPFLTPQDAAARFRTLEADATFGAEVRRARLAARTLHRSRKSRRASADVRSTSTALAS